MIISCVNQRQRLSKAESNSIYDKGGSQGRLQSRDNGQAQSFVTKENEERAVQSGKTKQTSSRDTEVPDVF